MSRSGRVLVFVAAIMATGAMASSHRDIAIRVEPQQKLEAIAIRGGDLVRSVEVRDGKAVIPADLPLPWTVSMTRFESSPYTKADLDQGLVLVVRELGTLRGILRRTEARLDSRMTWLLKRAADLPFEMDIAVPPDGAFAIRVPAGQYIGAVIGPTSGTRLRSGIVIRPGAATDLGVLPCAPTRAASLRVLDGKHRRPIANARVTWDPPAAALNASAAKDLYARRWTRTTDARGLVRFPSVGPVPIPARWIIEAEGYAPRRTSLLQLLGEGGAAALPDVHLHPEVIVVVRATLPWLNGDFRKASLTIAEPEGPQTRRFRAIKTAALKEGETTFRLHEYGKKRLTVSDASGKTLLYRDIEVTSQTTTIDFRPESIEIHGRVTRDDEVVEGIPVTLSDPQDGRVLLARTKTDEDGEYRLRTYQSGQLFLYARGKGSAVSKRIDAAQGDIRVDFELPNSGFALSVVDSATGTPIAGALVDQRLDFGGEGGAQSQSQTDANGRFLVNGHPDGTAKVHIQATGYRARDLELPITKAIEETVVKLDRSEEVFGRVVDVHGVPVAGASVSGGYDSELTPQAPFETITDAQGRFRFDSAPTPGTLFYVAAARHALGIALLREGTENTVVLHPPGTGVVTILPDDAPPTKVYLVIPAPAGGSMIPTGALLQLAEANGMNPYQLQGTARDGTLVVPAFLGPGTYDLYLALKGGKPFLYRKIGTVATPLNRNVVLPFKSP